MFSAKSNEHDGNSEIFYGPKYSPEDGLGTKVLHSETKDTTHTGRQAAHGSGCSAEGA